MKNAKERNEFIRNNSNWEVMERTSTTRISRIEYGGEYRYRLEVYVMCSVFNYEKRIGEEQPRWLILGYYKDGPANGFGALEYQSFTDLMKWLHGIDRKVREKQ